VATISEYGRHADGGGLYLSISPNGGRRWVAAFPKTGGVANGQTGFEGETARDLPAGLNLGADDEEPAPRAGAIAKRHGWHVVSVFEDAGISGAKGRDQRPGLEAVMKAIARRDIDMVAAWSVDRLGRSLMDLLGFLQELHAKGVDLFLHQQGIDTSTPAGKAMFQMMGVFAEFERAMIRERVLAGLARAREQGTKLGRRRLEDADADKAAAIRAARASGLGIRRIARDLGVGVGTVLRITGEAA